MHDFKDQSVQNAADFYVLAIGTGKPAEAIKKYVGHTYIQHNLAVADGPDGFLQNFEGFTQRVPNRDIQVIRGFRDEQFVFLHVLQDLGRFGIWLTMDFFRFENEKIVEHWDNLEKMETMEIALQQIGGTTEIRDLEKTISNKQIIKTHLCDGLICKDQAIAEKYVNVQNYRHHLGKTGGDWSLPSATFFPEQNPPSLQYQHLHKLIGQGNFVASQSEGILNGNPAAFYDLFRLEKGKIVENWSLTEMIPDRKTWAHGNGKF